MQQCTAALVTLHRQRHASMKGKRGCERKSPTSLRWPSKINRSTEYPTNSDIKFGRNRERASLGIVSTMECFEILPRAPSSGPPSLAVHMRGDLVVEGSDSISPTSSMVRHAAYTLIECYHRRRRCRPHASRSPRPMYGVILSNMPYLNMAACL